MDAISAFATNPAFNLGVCASMIGSTVAIEGAVARTRFGNGCRKHAWDVICAGALMSVFFWSTLLSYLRP